METETLNSNQEKAIITDLKILEKSKGSVEKLAAMKDRIQKIKKTLGPKYEQLRILKAKIEVVSGRIDSFKKEKTDNQTAYQSKKSEI
jgi:hypothetical protein